MSIVWLNPFFFALGGRSPHEAATDWLVAPLWLFESFASALTSFSPPLFNSHKPVRIAQIDRCTGWLNMGCRYPYFYTAMCARVELPLQPLQSQREDLHATLLSAIIQRDISESFGSPHRQSPRAIRGTMTYDLRSPSAAPVFYCHCAADGP
jgi:hypothetical protein